MGAIVHGHFRLTSGRHSDIYFEKERLFTDTKVVGEICTALKWELVGLRVQYDLEPDIILGPATLGALLAFELARELNQDKDFGASALVVPLCAVRQNGGLTIKGRNAAMISGQHVLIVDDVLTMGTTLKELIHLVRQLGGTVIGVAVIVDRSELTAEEQMVPHLFRVLDLEAKSWPAESCELCRQDVQLNQQLGHGYEEVHEPTGAFRTGAGP